MNKAERLHNEAEVEASNNWQELEKIQSNKANIVTEKRFNSQIDKDQELSEIAERVKNNCYKRDQDFTNDNVDNLNLSAISNTNINNKPKKIKSILKYFANKIDGYYEQMNRPSIEAYKQEMQENIFSHSDEAEYNTYFNGQHQLNSLQKIIQILVISMGIKSSIQKKIDIDNYKAAKEEYLEESERNFQQQRIMQSHQYEQYLQELQEEMAKKIEMDKMELAKQIANVHKDDKERVSEFKENLRKQRMREILEKNLNTRLLKIDDLDVQVYAKNPEVHKSIIKSGSMEVPVYDLRGYPFSILSTNILYKLIEIPVMELSKKSAISINIQDKLKQSRGGIMAMKLLKNPAKWCLLREQAEKENGGFGNLDNYTTDTICTSFTNSETNLLSYQGDEGEGNIPVLTYGFDHVPANSVLKIANGDGGTGADGKTEGTLIDSVDAIDQLMSAGGVNRYNEVTIKRYSENGVPQRPDYIITRNGKIDENALKHAKYFNIPIININNNIYKEKMAERGKAIIEMIYNENSYPKVNAYIEELRSMSIYKPKVMPIESIGKFDYLDSKKRGEEPYLNNKSGFNEFNEFSEFSDILIKEQVMRLNFLRESLIKATSILEESTRRGVFDLNKEKIYQDFSKFDTQLNDCQEKRTFYDDKSGNDCSVEYTDSPLSRNNIQISFILKGSDQLIKTVIYGKEDQAVEKLLKYNERLNEEIVRKNEDDSYYNSFEPLVRQYYIALHNNKSKGPKI